MPPYWIGNISEIWSEENSEGEEVGKKYYLDMISARPLSPHWFEILTTTYLVHFFSLAPGSSRSEQFQYGGYKLISEYSALERQKIRFYAC